MQTVQLQISNQRGLHARAAAKLIETAQQFDASILLMTEAGECIDLSLLDIIALGISSGQIITLKAEGTQAQPALSAMISLIQNKFGED